MPRRGYVQSAEHRKKRLKLILGAKNGSFKDGRRSYRRRAGAKPNDGSVVHHKNGDRTVNHRGNLERLTDGDRKPGRRTTPRHEQLTNRTDSIATAVAILREDAKGKKCPGGYWIPRERKCRSSLAQPKRSFKTGAENEYKPERGAFSHRTGRESEMSKRENIAWNAGAAALGVGLAGVGALALMGRTPKKNPYNTPEPVVEPLKAPERVTLSSSPSGVAEARISTPQLTTRPIVTIAPPPPPQEASIAARVAVAQAESEAKVRPKRIPNSLDRMIAGRHGDIENWKIQREENAGYGAHVTETYSSYIKTIDRDEMSEIYRTAGRIGVVEEGDSDDQFGGTFFDNQGREVSYTIKDMRGSRKGMRASGDVIDEETFKAAENWGGIITASFVDEKEAAWKRQEEKDRIAGEELSVYRAEVDRRIAGRAAIVPEKPEVLAKPAEVAIASPPVVPLPKRIKPSSLQESDRKRALEMILSGRLIPSESSPANLGETEPFKGERLTVGRKGGRKKKPKSGEIDNWTEYLLANPGSYNLKRLSKAEVSSRQPAVALKLSPGKPRRLSWHPINQDSLYLATTIALLKGH